MLTNIGLPGFLLILFFFGPLIIGTMMMGIQKGVQLKHTDSGLNKKGYYGYCWTYFLFGAFVPVFRGEIGIGLLHFIFTAITFGLFWLIMPFLYNKKYTNRLLTNGFKLSEDEELDVAIKERLGVLA